MSSSHKKKTIQGLNWSIANKFFTQGISIIVLIVLSRLLTPSQFGLIAMVMVLVRFAFIFQDFGMGSALVQKKDITDEDFNTVFIMNVGLGFLIMIIVILGAPLVVKFYSKPTLYWITILISLNFFVRAFSIVQESILKRELDFKKIFFINFYSTFISGSIAIILAFQGYGVWSLVAQSLALSILTCCLLWRSSPWRPNFKFSKEAFSYIMNFSLPLLGTQSLNYWVRNLDNLLIGKYWGAVNLGYYEKSYSMMLFPVSNVTGVISQVLFPSFSLIQEDKEKIKRIFLKVTRTIAFLSFPGLIGLSILADPVIIILLGKQWVGSIPIIKVLAFVGIIQSITALFGNLYLSQGATKLQFKVGLVLKVNAIILITIGVQYGVLQVAYVYLLSVMINFFPNIYFAGGLVNLKISEYVFNLLRIILCAVLMGVIVWYVDNYLLNDYPLFIQLIGGFLVGAISYFIFSCFFNRNSLFEIVNQMKENLGLIKK